MEELWLTVYRVARDSAVLNALVRAARAGKRVTVFMEVQARFDEESNLEWADRLEEVVLLQVGRSQEQDGVALPLPGRGEVVEINWRAVRLRTTKHELLVLPNAMLSKAAILKSQATVS